MELIQANNLEIYNEIYDEICNEIRHSRNNKILSLKDLKPISIRRKCEPVQFYIKNFGKKEDSHVTELDKLAIKFGYESYNIYREKYAKKLSKCDIINLYENKEDYYEKLEYILPEPYYKNKDCSLYLGRYVGENLARGIFNGAKLMPFGNKGYDIICNIGFKIDVKTACLNGRTHWSFCLNYNKIADYFLCIAFDNRRNLNPLHIWLIKSDDFINTNIKFNQIKSLTISITLKSLNKYKGYELIDKMETAVKLCEKFKLIQK